MSNKIKIGIAGNPNCGKTTIFNALTGGKQKVGNWPGVTVDRKSGKYLHEAKEIEVVDLPGIYSLSISSLDEKIARDYILSNHPDVIVNIVDASNLERNLYLTIQLIEMKVPLIVVINMMDVAAQKNIKVDIEKIKESLDCPVVCTVANKEEGIFELKNAVHSAFHNKKISKADIYFPDEVEDAIKHYSQELEKQEQVLDNNSRWIATKLLEGDIDLAQRRIPEYIVENVKNTQKEIEEVFGDDLDIVIADCRYGFINAICKQAVDRRDILRRDISELIDKVALNKYFGIPFFLLAMYLTFWVTINLGGAFIDFFDRFFGAIFVSGLGSLLSSIGAPVFFKALIADGIGGGIQTVSTFIPPIFFMFFCLAILEDSGYMPRAAFVMDGIMRSIGLPGKAFVPMLVGFGCNVPAIMATRTLGDERDRTLAIVMNPLMSCGARMPVYALFAAAFFPENGSYIVLALYVVGILLSIMTAFILQSTILKGEPSAFIMELPPYHIPTIKGILIHTWHRLRAFIIKAGKAILIVVIGLNLLSSLGTDGSFGNNNSQHSVLSKAGKIVTPIFRPMGISNKNWPASVGLISGIFAKEAVIGALDSIYSQVDNYSVENEKKKQSFVNSIKAAFMTVPQNISKLTMPFSFSGLIGADVDTSIGELEVNDALFGSMTKRFDGRVGAFAYLLFVLIYMPCIAAISAVYKELNLKWAVFCSLYLSVLAWMVSTLFYQAVTFYRHPGLSLGWIVFIAAVFTVFLISMKRLGAKNNVI